MGGTGVHFDQPLPSYWDSEEEKRCDGGRASQVEECQREQGKGKGKEKGGQKGTPIPDREKERVSE